MKLSELTNSNIEAGEYFRGCQNLSNYPDLPFFPGTVASFPVAEKTVHVLKASLLPFEETCLTQDETVGRKIYNVLKALKFYYIVVIGAEGIDAAYVPDDIFINEDIAKGYAAQHLSELVKAA